MKSIESKVCVVTGASSGIGAATARDLASKGATVVLAARREDLLRSLTDELTGRGAAASWLRVDVTGQEDLERLRDHVRSEHGRCDVLINNAGVPGGGGFGELSLDRIRTVTETNYMSILVATKLFLDLLVDAKGHVVNVASLAGRYALPGAAVYTASKHAVVALSEALYYEMKPAGVMVTVVNPGIVATEGFFPKDSPLWKDPTLKPFIMKPERVAKAIVDAIRHRRGPEISVPRWLAAPQAVRVLAPPLYRAAVQRIVGYRAREAEAPVAEAGDDQEGATDGV
ncbi:MAG: SDR family NAD(P)-dependent oxidoreductase [Actinomycetota bacterium]|nr:SDR family NAD(P)-dependent oxidoreductase [Actinomycetota bacterium]